MIQMQTRLVVADNTGAKEVMCFKVLGGSKKRTAGLGDIIVCSVKSVIAGSDVGAAWSITTDAPVSAYGVAASHSASASSWRASS